MYYRKYTVYLDRSNSTITTLYCMIRMINNMTDQTQNQLNIAFSLNHIQFIICLSHNLKYKYFIEECMPYSKLIDRIPTRMSVHYSEEAARKYFKTN